MQMAADDTVEEFGVVIEDRRAGGEAGVVHEQVDPAEMIERRLDDPARARPFGHGIAVRDGHTPGLLDFGHDIVRRGGIVALAVE